MEHFRFSRVDAPLHIVFLCRPKMVSHEVYYTLLYLPFSFKIFKIENHIQPSVYRKTPHFTNSTSEFGRHHLLTDILCHTRHYRYMCVLTPHILSVQLQLMEVRLLILNSYITSQNSIIFWSK